MNGWVRAIEGRNLAIKYRTLRPIIGTGERAREAIILARKPLGRRVSGQRISARAETDTGAAHRGPSMFSALVLIERDQQMRRDGLRALSSKSVNRPQSCSRFER